MKRVIVIKVVFLLLKSANLKVNRYCFYSKYRKQNFTLSSVIAYSIKKKYENKDIFQIVAYIKNIQVPYNFLGLIF